MARTGLISVDKGKTIGFTLAELLIALAILGVIATFTIPKVLQSQQSSDKMAKLREAMGTVSGAYQAYQQQVGVDANFRSRYLSPFINYVRLTTTGTIDNVNTFGSVGCSNNSPCLHMHNGSVIRLGAATFNGTGALNGVFMEVDPDGTYSGLTTGPGKSIDIWLYYNGRLSLSGMHDPNTTHSGGTFNPDTDHIPEWYQP